MSLKAKIEAVIYASEEPVTLAQLVGLLGEEGQAELDAQHSQQTLLDLDESPEPESDDPDALNAELLTTEPEPSPPNLRQKSRQRTPKQPLSPNLSPSR